MTPLTSLVVVKPNETSAVDAEAVRPGGSRPQFASASGGKQSSQFILICHMFSAFRTSIKYADSFSFLYFYVNVLCLSLIHIYACDLNCVCSFRMSFLFVFVCLYISNCSRVSNFPVIMEALETLLREGNGATRKNAFQLHAAASRAVSYTHLDVYKRQI